MQQYVCIEIESVVYGMCWVVVWNVECFEVVVVVFDFWVFGDFIVDVVEVLFDVFQCVGDWMQVVVQLVMIGQGDIDVFCGQLGGQCGFFQFGFMCVQCILDFFFGYVDQCVNFWLFFGWQVVQGFYYLGQFVFFVEVVNLDLFQGIDVFGVLYSF